MEDIRDVREVECVNSIYVKPVRIIYKQNGVEKNWDVIETHDNVACVVFNESTQRLIFVQQFRPPVYLNRVKKELAKQTRDLSCKSSPEPIDPKRFPGSLGITLELCAGMMDKDKSPERTVQEELYEEIGYQVPLECIEKVTSCRYGIGTEGCTQNLFYCTVDNSHKVTAGGGLEDEGEMINVIEMSLDEVRRMIKDDSVMRDPCLLFGVMWFLYEKLPMLNID